jgi:hypothetical protein
LENDTITCGFARLLKLLIFKGLLKHIGKEEGGASGVSPAALLGLQYIELLHAPGGGSVDGGLNICLTSGEIGF